MTPSDRPHRRYNPLLDEWVLVSPHRTQRPWQGQVEDRPPRPPSYEPTCYLCPGNARAGGHTNPHYESTFVFRNDFAALLSDPPSGESDDGLFRSSSVSGECRVLCYAPRHDLTMAEMSVDQIHQVVELWCAQAAELGERFKWVQVFENKGAMMGASSPHPHGQIWAGDWVPQIMSREDANQRGYFERNGSSLLLDYALRESGGERVVVENDDWLFVVPYWAVWPFEGLLLPKTSLPRLTDSNDTQRRSLATILQGALVRYDNLFEASFPYSLGWHFAPFGQDASPWWQTHLHVYPPLLRSATVRKFMVGFELLAESQRDLTPEQAAARLREVSDVHYTLR